MIKPFVFIVCLLLSVNFWGQIATNGLAESPELIGGMKKDCDEKVIQYIVPTGPNDLNENNKVDLKKYTKWDLTEKYLRPTWNEIQQGTKQGSCTAFTVAFAITIQRNIDYYSLVKDKKLVQYSPAFIFNIAKSKYREPYKSRCGEGISYIDAYLIVKENGLATIENTPYHNASDGCTEKYYPNKEAYNNAKNTLIGNFQRPFRSVNFFKSLLVTSPFYPICIGVYLSSEYDKASIEKERLGKWKIPGQSNGTRMHAMLIVGFDNDKNAFKVLDWRGKNYGDNGVIWMDYSLIENPQVVFDAYIVSHDIEYIDPKTGSRTGDATGIDPMNRFSFWIKSGYFTTKGELHIFCSYTNHETKKATFKITDEETGELVKDNVFLTSGGGNICFMYKDDAYRLTLVEIAKRGNKLNIANPYAAVVRLEKISATDCK